MAVWLFLVAASSLLSATQSADKTLFDDNDHVVIYKEGTYQTGFTDTDNTHQSGLYGNNQAHLFLLYSSWCGHCQAFAPKYKELAAEIAGWSHVVSVTGVDCVYDTPVCRKYGVGGYPEIRFIGPNALVEPLDTGELYKGERSVDAIRNWIVDRLSSNATSPPASWPNLHPLSEEEARGLVSGEAAVKPKLILVTDRKLVSQEVLLFLNDPTIRYVEEGSPAASLLGAHTSGLVVISNSGHISHITNIDPTRGEMRRAAQNVLGWGRKSGTGQEADTPDGKNQETIQYVDTKLQYKLFELDLQSALNTAFFFEVSAKSEFSDKDLENLRNFLKAAHRCGSWSNDYKQQLKQIKGAVVGSSSLTPAAWTGILASAGAARNTTFIACAGSLPTTRGFTCSVWLLFHTMLTSCHGSEPGSVSVLRAIHGYLDSFFTCTDCRQHFLAMSERMKLLEIADDTTAVLAMWEAHNQVNARLSETLHDPYFPKPQYPPRSLCAQCVADNQFVSTEVFNFLMKQYRRVKTPGETVRSVGEGAPPPRVARIAYTKRDPERMHRWRGLDQSDWAFSVFVWLMCMVVLVTCALALGPRRLWRVCGCCSCWVKYVDNRTSLYLK